MIGEEVSGSFKVYHFDYRGSTVAITDSNCNITDIFTYDTYGKLTARTGTTKTTFLYNGRDGVMYEDDTGLYYMRARYYSPELRRFINADKVHGDISNALTLNRYAFCNGDPANGVDPTGFIKERGNVSTGKFYMVTLADEYVTNPKIVRYDVPLYNQGRLSLCWAFCQTMTEDFESGKTRTQDEATNRAIEIAKMRVNYGENWNKGGWPYSMNRFKGIKANQLDEIEDLYKLLLDNGPVYAYYNNPKVNSAHLIVVTGVDVDENIIYTNNPQGHHGEQTFEEFNHGYFARNGTNNTPLSTYYTVKGHNEYENFESAIRILYGYRSDLSYFAHRSTNVGRYQF